MQARCVHCLDPSDLDAHPVVVYILDRRGYVLVRNSVGGNVLSTGLAARAVLTM
eukprot:COSAG03_NODE_251_length_9941_cov_18.085145_14_plen_53_part_01